MIDVMLILLGVAGVWGIGMALAYFLFHKISTSTEKTFEFAELLGLGIVFGFGGTAIFYLLWGIIGLSFSLFLAWVWMGVGIAAGAGTLFLLSRNRKQKDNKPSPSSASDREFRSLCLGVLFFLAVTTVIQTLMTPQRFWDERAIFGLKSIVIFEDGTILSESLHDPDFVQYHPKYPLLIPLNEVHFYLLLGEVNDRWSKVLFPLLYLGMVLTFLGVLLRSTSQKILAWMFALMLATVPSMVPWEYGFLSGQADGPVACFHTVALLYFWSFLRAMNNPISNRSSSKNSLVIAGLSAALAIFTKDEGIAFFLIELIALGIVTLVYFRSQLSSMAGSIFKFALTVAIVVAPWFYHRNQLPATTEMTYFSRMSTTTLAGGSAAFFWAIQHLFHRMFLEAWRWGLQWWVLSFSILAFPSRARKPSQLFLLLNLLGALSALILAGIISPTPVQEHIGGSSSRFLIQISGIAVLFVAGQWISEQD